MKLQIKLKKIHRDDNGILSMQKRNELIAEIGDVLWYCAALASELKTSLNTIALLNIDKLANRKIKNKIKGDGDNR